MTVEQTALASTTEVAPAATVVEPADDVLVAREVTKRFGGLVALHAVNMRIRRGTVYSLIGPNGAGKTTLFNVIAGIFPPSDGEVVIGGKRLIAPSRRAWLEPILW